MAQHTSDELAQVFGAGMGPELGPLFHKLWLECAALHLKWGEYVALFGTGQSRVDVLNKAAPVFAHVVESVLREDVLLHICRLTDAPFPKRRTGQHRLTVNRLRPLVAEPLREHVRRLAEVAASKAGFARDWRDRHIAHRDLLLALNPDGAKPLAAATGQAISEAIEAIAAVLTWWRPTTATFSEPITKPSPPTAKRSSECSATGWTPSPNAFRNEGGAAIPGRPAAMASGLSAVGRVHACRLTPSSRRAASFRCAKLSKPSIQPSTRRTDLNGQ
jgi:hypothetical protein